MKGDCDKCIFRPIQLGAEQECMETCTGAHYPEKLPRDRSFKLKGVRPKAEILKNHDEDGRRTWPTIIYRCPTCGRISYEYAKDTSCRQCGTFFDWGDHEPTIEMSYAVKW